MASSSTTTGASSIAARAMARRWRCPPERVPPRSPTTVSYPSGRAVTKACAPATRAARSTCSSVASGTAAAMFSRTVPRNRTLSCSTTATDRRTLSSVRSRRLWPSKRTAPDSGSRRRDSSAARLDLPAPDAPTIATRSPGRTARSRPRSTGRPGT